MSIRVIARVALAVLLAMAALAGSGNSAEARCGSQGVYVFSAHWCPACKSAEQFLRNNGVPYRRIETTGNRAAQNFMLQHFNTTAVPVIVVDGYAKVGYNADWLQSRLCL
jgi:glutaredoxin